MTAADLARAIRETVRLWRREGPTEELALDREYLLFLAGFDGSES